MPFGIGWAELLVIFAIVLLLFGARRLPEIAQGLGKGIREFKRAMKDTTDEVRGSLDTEGTRDYKRAIPGSADREARRDDRERDDRARDTREQGDRERDDRPDDPPDRRR
ncbi:MAG TPA: twin-arginine translocase TatA/TatE family subunit [candidate division Zixibacteria bacterium]|nr:twin-arginine translocase TatA/TatE family subunit [candidate division Zixibacteria bacterium]MDD4917857.1 twin-arginine translocase TatA/TatE family subunit [candidate division Zixibacteria bacterium]MDM7973531.1 twin-arginine translocase TatA/TatE family subunit [candidate division Zixibacteria bacterium]HOD67397.1 twin-arginine translocase TatA/TatE family subunit [candidate division Zixibacteria bacterium]HOZ07056.1 twin-arginine translocase TatA/TatE family subunit [candidate division Z